jgi:hypothetical protein
MQLINVLADNVRFRLEDSSQVRNDDLKEPTGKHITKAI